MRSTEWRAVDKEGIVLARRTPFRLGAVEVRPATRELIGSAGRETVEPRVMQVLVALARATGEVVSRDELIQSCWGGRIVGEDSISRVISRIRRLQETIGAGSFELETITKVGYRLVVPSAASTRIAALAPAKVERRPGMIDRRLVLGGAAATGAAVLGGYLWRSLGATASPSAIALTLYRKGLEAERQGLAEQTAQAGAYFLEATKADPGFSAAWGSLALHYRHRLEGGVGDPETLAAWSRSAAKRALQLDPDNADAQVATVLIRPWYRNWAVMEADCRRLLERYPDHWLLRGTLGRVLCNVGRWNEGIEPFREATDRDPFLPIGRYYLALALWGAERLQEAEAAIESASERWPSHPAIWFLRFNFLAHTGRPEKAIALAEDIESRPFGIPESEFSTSIASARALATRTPRDIDAAVSPKIKAAAGNIRQVPGAVQLCAALARVDSVFAILRDYFELGEGSKSIGPLTRRHTDFLFMPQTASLRSDSRFRAVTEGTGLEDYWRATRTLPDYRL